jgi:hypothetical protein
MDLSNSQDSGESVKDKSENSDEQVKNSLGLIAGVAGTVATSLVGFGILPDSRLAEQVLNFFTAAFLSGAIIAGIGAWRNVRRFIVMSISAGLAIVCLAVLAIVAQGRSVPQAIVGLQSSEASGASPSPSIYPAGEPSMTTGAVPSVPAPVDSTADSPSAEPASGASSPAETAKVPTWKGQISIAWGAGDPASFTDLSQPSLAPNPPAPFNTVNYEYDEDVYSEAQSATEGEIIDNPNNPTTFWSLWNEAGIPSLTQCESAAQGGGNSVTVAQGETFCFISSNNSVGELTVKSINDDFSSTSPVVVTGTIWWTPGRQ